MSTKEHENFGFLKTMSRTRAQTSFGTAICFSASVSVTSNPLSDEIQTCSENSNIPAFATLGPYQVLHLNMSPSFIPQINLPFRYPPPTFL